MANLIRALLLAVVIILQLFKASAQGASYSLLNVFTNPTPANNDYFSHSIAAMGSNLVLIGAWQDDVVATDAGAAYLFSVNGTLLATFTSPSSANNNYFGWSVAALGSDRVLIGEDRGDVGAMDAGTAYLFNTNGVLLTTFTNPTPFLGDRFGFSVAALGSDRVLIGAISDNTGAMDTGAAYLFSTNGTLLVTFTNPTPVTLENFGFRVAAVASDRVLIGSPGASLIGEAYLFSTNGSLLATFTNPTPAFGDNFSISIAVLSNDRVLIGAHSDDTGASDAGAAYLFSTNGTLLATFTNPAPAASDVFGASVASVGDDRVLIGAYQADTGATNAGAAYLFGTNGVLLTTVTNPTPELDDRFGFSLAAVRADQLVIGAYQDDTGATNAGTVYLFSLTAPAAEPPSLKIQPTTTNTVAVSWPSPSTGWTLQENTNGVSSVNWSNAPGSIQDDGTNKTLIVNPPTGNRFYRLFKP